MKKYCKEHYALSKTVLLFTFLFSITFVLLSKSPIHFWIGEEVEADSAVFNTIALAMDKGYIPYRDSFDHKGPLLYLLNYLGRQIATYRGLWLIEFITVFFTFYIMYRIGCLCCNHLHAAIILLFASAPLFDFYCNGNMVEEFAMPFIALSLYLFLDYLLNGNITACRLFLCGASLSAVCMLRLNMISVWIVFCIAITILLVKQKNNSLLIYFIRYFFIGFLVFGSPFLLWLTYHNALKAFWEQYIIFNGIYCRLATFPQLWHTFFYCLEHKTVLFALTVILFLFIKQRDKIFGVYLLYMLISFLMISISGRTYSHYNMVIIPALMFPIAALCGQCEKQWKNAAGQTALLLLMLLLLTTTLHTDWLLPMQDLAKIYQEKDKDHFSQKLRTVCRLIGENTDDNDKISVYGNWDQVYVMSNRMHATRYSYQYPIGAIVPEIKDRYFAELEMERPKIIVLIKGSFDDVIKSFLINNGYRLLWSEDDSWGDGEGSAIVYIRDSEQKSIP